MNGNSKKSWAQVAGILTIFFIICVIIVTYQINKASDKVINTTIENIQKTINEANAKGIPFPPLGIIFSVLGIASLAGDIYSLYRLFKQSRFVFEPTHIIKHNQTTNVYYR